MAAQFDLVIRGGTVLDGTGAEPREADVAVDRTAASPRSGAVAGSGREEIDADGPGRDAGLRRHPHPLRRPGDLGRAGSRRRRVMA